MQGDVTRIVSMNNKERRTLIDELAGVALFDSRIEQTHSKLNDVFERQEKCEILENELYSSKIKLEKECDKAKKYRELKEKLIHLKELEKILLYKNQINIIESIKQKFSDFDESKILFNQQKKSISQEIEVLQESLEVITKELNEKGEDTLIKVNSDIASINANLRELERIASRNKIEEEKLQEQRDKIAIAKKNIELEKKDQKTFNNTHLEKLNKEIHELSSKYQLSRKKLSYAAGESGKFSKQNIELNANLNDIKSVIEPLESKKRHFEEAIIQNNIQKKSFLRLIFYLMRNKKFGI